MTNKLILNYNDAVLYSSDVALLESDRAWLNDSCINFYLTVLQQRHDPAAIKFMDPAVISFLMHQCDHDDLEDYIHEFTMPTDKIIIPISDGYTPSAVWPGRGSHWSLLIISMPQQCCWHLDSVQGSSNHASACAVMDKFDIILKVTLSLIEVVTPQQCNGYDCGLHVLCAAEELPLCQNVATVEAILQQRVGTGFGTDMRQRVLKQVRLCIQ